MNDEVFLREIRDRILMLRDKLLVGLARKEITLNDMQKFRRTLGSINVDTLLADMKEHVSKFSAWSVEQGMAQIDAAVNGAGIGQLLPAVPPSSIALVAEFDADRIKTITTELLPKVAQTVSAAFLGLASPGEIVSRMMHEFDITLRRAEVIVRTENKRLQNLGSRARMEQLVPIAQEENVPMRKVWLHSTGTSAGSAAKGKGRKGYKPRENHRAMHGATVGVKEKFELPGLRGGVYVVDGPYDPALPAEEVVNCYCDTAVEIDFDALERMRAGQGQSSAVAVAA
mgnify:CR=1 FL=1